MRPLQLKRLSTLVKSWEAFARWPPSGRLRQCSERPLSNKHPSWLKLLSASLSRGNNTSPTHFSPTKTTVHILIIHNVQTKLSVCASRTAWVESNAFYEILVRGREKISAWWLLSCNLNKRGGLKAAVLWSETRRDILNTSRFADVWNHFYEGIKHLLLYLNHQPRRLGPAVNFHCSFGS